MDPERLAYLIDICKSSKASPDEIEELEEWYNSFDLESDILGIFSESERRLIESDIWQSLAQRKALLSPAKKANFLFHRNFLSAAILFLVLGTGLYVYLQKEPLLARRAMANREAIILPGEDRATLTLENGLTVDLNTITVGEKIRGAGVSIVKEDDGSISYVADQRALSTASVPFNTVSTPRGGQYRVSLPDGSMVWLNAASSIRYPAVFNDAERVVYLTGEAYFEIQKSSTDNGNRIPFIVVTKQQEVEVLGTHFNVKAYEDESATLTTLLEGKVRVMGLSAGERMQERILQVGESAAWDQSEFKVRRGEAVKAVGWKNGKFIFTGENIKEIMKAISRWYDVEVAYKGDLRNVNFAGSLSRYENINEILKKLELTGTVRFEIQKKDTPDGVERRVVVMR